MEEILLIDIIVSTKISQFSLLISTAESSKDGSIFFSGRKKFEIFQMTSAKMEKSYSNYYTSLPIKNNLMELGKWKPKVLESILLMVTIQL